MYGSALSGVLDATMCALLLSTAALAFEYWRQRRELARFVNALVGGALHTEETIFKLGRYIFASVRRGGDPLFLSPILQPLGASPLAVLRQGGCCSGTHRLFIASLEVIGIRAAQLTVYHRTGTAAHCLAQVDTAVGTLLVDVDYGICYRHPNGAALGLADLRGGVAPVMEPFAEGLTVHIEEPPEVRGAGYPKDDYYKFDFRLTRTANWTSTRTRRMAHSALHLLTRGRIDCLLLPPILEWPQVLLAIAILCVTAMLAVARLTLSA